MGVASLSAGCSDTSSLPGEQSEERVGNVALKLQLAPGATLASVSYAITGPGAFAQSGSFDVSKSSKISGTVGGIPAGSGYTIALSGSTADASFVCNGSASFDVTAHTTSAVTVAVTCKEKARLGSVLVNGKLNLCAVADGLSAGANDLTVGGSTVLSATAHDSDAAPAALSYQWTTSSGTLSSATAQSPTFTCTAAGPATLTVSVSDGDTSPGCVDTLSTTINCSEAVCAGGCDDGNPCTTPARRISAAPTRPSPMARCVRAVTSRSRSSASTTFTASSRQASWSAADQWAARAS